MVVVAVSLKCYSCQSSQPGCGKELNIRIQRWKHCKGMEDGAGENFCVKIIKKVGSEEFLTRECLRTLRDYTYHRRQMPTVQRHGYCSAARTNDPFHRYDESTIYCFCNDWNGCNSAPGLARRSWLPVSLAMVGSLLARFCV
ncbi:hypothetical protein NP493_180g07033 [Ridgeia piscesae]|uniref:Protein quiver n=1 Tax=Ridgeia piscesae TaxID=27915 RepID=A0AAD9P2R0_RIDPI|nr:hypothetical protein NP493_180g07033 [Ridgeia piscesae]